MTSSLLLSLLLSLFLNCIINCDTSNNCILKYVITCVCYNVCMYIKCYNFSCKSQSRLVDLIGQSLRLELLVTRQILPQILPIFL